MHVLEWAVFINGSSPVPSSAMTIGVFDGVHRGHLILIKNIVQRGPCPTVITFIQNPKKILKASAYEGDIFSLRQKLSVFEELGVARTVLIDFSGNFGRMKGKEFINLLKDRGKLAFLAIGVNFRCGYKLDTDALCIKKLNEKDGIQTELVPPLTEGARPVSSSRIRDAVKKGRLDEAAALLGRRLELDLSDIPPEAVYQAGIPFGRGGVFFDAASQNRIVPPAGFYEALLFEANSKEGRKAEIFIHDGKVFLPFPFSAARVEFYNRIEIS
jgi:FAD synthase